MYQKQPYRYDYLHININFPLITISVAELPKNFDNTFFGARAVTSAAGQGAIVQMGKHLYEVTCEISGCSWSILAQNLDVGVTHTVMMMLPVDYTSKCDSCKAGFFGDFCEGKQKFSNQSNHKIIFNTCLMTMFQIVSFFISTQCNLNLVTLN